MKLDNSVQHNMTTEFECLDSDGVTWINGFSGRFSPVDRFLSNFHRPLQRRMMHTKPEDTLPASGVIRRKATSEVYLVGQTRFDDDAGDIYQQISMVHLVTNKSSGIGTLTRKVVDGARPDSTIGELVDSVVGTMYCTIEYKNSRENFGSDGIYSDRYIIFAPCNAEFQDDDVLSLNGDDFVINSPFFDSDLASAVTTREPDDRITGTYKRPSATFAYDADTGVVARNFDEYLVTCTVVSEKKKSNDVGKYSDYEVYLKSPSFPITPKTGDYFLADGIEMKITRCESTHDGKYQWRLICDRSF